MLRRTRKKFRLDENISEKYFMTFYIRKFPMIRKTILNWFFCTLQYRSLWKRHIRFYTVFYARSIWRLSTLKTRERSFEPSIFCYIKKITHFKYWIRDMQRDRLWISSFYDCWRKTNSINNLWVSTNCKLLAAAVASHCDFSNKVLRRSVCKLFSRERNRFSFFFCEWTTRQSRTNKERERERERERKGRGRDWEEREKVGEFSRDLTRIPRTFSRI